ncbi:MAG: AmmeMemoRadiSam system protein B [Candidatus Nitrospinota bacterium M3_3B_026]
MNEYPALRPIEAAPVMKDGETMMALFDPARLTDAQLMVSYPAFCLLALMDGKRSVERVMEDFRKRFDIPVSREDVEGLIEQMDIALMLNNERFARHRDAVIGEFLSRPSRAPCLAGQSYPEDPAELGELIDGLLAGGAALEDGPPPRAMIAPHIDFRVGADMMAAGWREAARSGADLFVILGTGHTLTDDFFSALDKDFDTPAGPMRVDRPFLEALEKNFGEDIRGQVLAHMKEHSIEFQALFMARLFRDRPEVTAVPILLSFPETVWGLDHPVFNGERIKRLLAAIRKTAEESGRKVFYVASVDFSHVGARFGDKGALGDDDLARIRADDEELLAALGRMDMDGFSRKIAAVNEANRVCGYPALHALLSVSDADRGELLEYKQNLEGGRETMVSFASMILR